MAYHKKTHHKKGKASKKHHKTQRSRRGGVNEDVHDIETGLSKAQLMEEGKIPQTVENPQSENKLLDINTLSNAMELGQAGQAGQAGQNGGKRRTKKRSAKRRNNSRKFPRICLMCKKKCKSCKCSNCGCPTCRVRTCKCRKSPKSGKSRKSMIKRLLGM